MALEALRAFDPAVSQTMLPGLALGAAGGLAARGSGRVSGGAAAFGLSGGLLVTGVLVLLHLGAAEWLARIVGQRIAGTAPLGWPPFVFEPELSGWLRACGALPSDPQAVARACGLVGPLRLPKPADITFLATLSLPALAVANRLPVLLGDLWALLPVLLGLMGVLSVLHGAALAVSEGLLFGLFNPSGLPSYRLAMARLCLLTLVLALLAVDPLPQMPAQALGSALAALLGVAFLLLALAQARRTPPVVRGP
jgi:hypothetical protein